MRQFKDENGRPWTISINVGSVKRVRGLVGLDLLDLKTGTVLQSLAEDPVVLGDVLWVLCQEEAEKNNIGELDFAAALAGDALTAATDCLLEEIADFFPRPQREVLRKLLAKGKIVQERQAQQLAAAADKAMEEMEAQVTSGVSSTSVQESSESSPGPGHCES